MFRLFVFHSISVVTAVVKWAEAGAVGNAQRCPRQAGRFERSSNCPLVHSLSAATVRGRCAKPAEPLSFEFAAQHLVNALARFIQLA
jgi:hypothetical protein